MVSASGKARGQRTWSASQAGNIRQTNFQAAGDGVFVRHAALFIAAGEVLPTAIACLVALKNAVMSTCAGGEKLTSSLLDARSDADRSVSAFSHKDPPSDLACTSNTILHIASSSSTSGASFMSTQRSKLRSQSAGMGFLV